jgi:endogenous inhibitor of DNA gyrase (YacG/DUF329 family)
MRSHGLPSSLKPCLVCQKPYRSSPGDGNKYYCSRRCYFIGRKAFVIAMRSEQIRAQILEALADEIRIAA